MDLNQDRILDLVTANVDSDPSDISVLIGGGQNTAGDGTFAPPQNYQTGVFETTEFGMTAPDAVPRPIAVVAGDFDGDGVVDLIVANQGFPAGTFTDPATPFLDQEVGSLTLLLGRNTLLDD